MLSTRWLTNTRAVLDDIESSQLPAIQRAAGLMADSIAAERWVHTFGCGHATIPVEEMYPRIGGFVGFHPMIELPLTFFTRITGEMGIHQFLFLERAEGYGEAIMKGYAFDPRDTMWIFSHTGINNVNIDIALRAKALGMRVGRRGGEIAPPFGPDAVRDRRCGDRHPRAGGRLVRAIEASRRQRGAGVDGGLRRRGLDDDHDGRRAAGRAWGAPVHPSVA
jgi:hypothetical protein